MTPPRTIEALNAEYGLPDRLRFEAGNGGLTCARITTPQAEATMYLHGAHVTHFEPRGQTHLLFMSTRSHFAEGKSIRGGVPVIFPWFGAKADEPTAPAHGFARVRRWKVESTAASADGSVTLTMRLDADEQTLSAWPHRFALRHRVLVGAALDMALEVQNADTKPFTFEEALHTYLAVSDVRQVSVTGLAGATYLDKTDAMRRKTQDAEGLGITGETDRVYLNSTAVCVVDDPAGGRSMAVEKEGSLATVIWNPWIAKAQAMSDFGDDEWQRMLCVETANTTDHAVALAPGASHVMRAILRTTTD